MVLQERARDAILALIDKERDGEQIDRALLKNVLGIFIEVGMGTMDNYQSDFEAFLLEETSAFYQRKAAAWIQVWHHSYRVRRYSLDLDRYMRTRNPNSVRICILYWPDPRLNPCTHIRWLFRAFWNSAAVHNQQSQI